MVRNPPQRGDEPQREQPEEGGGPDVRQWRQEAIEKGQAGAGGPVQDVRQAAGEVADQIKQRSKGMLDQQKTRLAEQLRQFGDALHETARSLHEHEKQAVGDVTQGLAQRVDDAAQFLEQRSIGSIADDLTRSLRRHPELTVLGLFVGGLVLARFLKASQQRSHEPAEESPLFEQESIGRDAGQTFEETYGPGAVAEGSDLPMESGEAEVSDFDIAESTEYPTAGRSPTSHGPAGPERPPQVPRANPPLSSPPTGE